MKNLFYLFVALALLRFNLNAQPSSSVGDSLKKSEREFVNQALQKLGTNTPVASFDPGHKLTPGDIVEVKVYQEEELNARARLDDDGTISIPLLGLVRIGGMTIDESQKLVRGLLEKDYLQNPQVSVSVLEAAKHRFSILGEVKQPGFYTIPEDGKLDLLQAIAMAGGYTEFARAGKATIKRTVDGVETVLKANGKSMAKKQTTAVMEIQPNDIIVVDASLF